MTFSLTRLLLALLCLAAVPRPAAAKPGDVARSVASPGRTPTGLAFDGRSLYVADRRTTTIYVVDPATGAVTGQLPTPGWQPEGLAWDGEMLWAADGHERKLYRIDPKRRLVVHTLDTPGRSPHGLAFDPAAKLLWVADDRRGELIAVSPVDGAELRTIPAPTKDIRGLAWDGRYLWAADRITDRIYLVHPERGDVIFAVAAPGPHVQGLAWDRAARRLWAVDYQTDTIYHLVADDGTRQARLGSPKELVLELTHHVRNLGPHALRDVVTWFAVPAARDHQEVLSVDWDVAPAGFVTDRQGQKLARVTAARVAGGAAFTPTMRVRARLHETQWYVFPEQVGGLGEIPADVRQRYLGDDPKYLIHDAFLRKSVAEALGGERHPYWIARKLARYIDDRMRYEMAGGWEAAPTVLKRGTGSCSEYTFAFVAMCRAAGLPARWVGAVVVRRDDASWDTDFHRWAEVYLPRYGWVPFDVQHADQPSPAAHADALGHLDAHLLVTTVSGGQSEHLDWGYNTNARFACEGRCQVFSDAVGEWSPVLAAPKPPASPPLPGAGRSPR
jgi:YVTN family beta-propeller protein